MMTTKYDLVAYYASSECLSDLCERYGDKLERLTSQDKLALLAVLAIWLSEDDHDYTLANSYNDFPGTGSIEFPFVLEMLDESVAPDDALSLQIAIANQLKDGVYA